MTRSGAKPAAIAATRANGHAAGSSQGCHTLKDAYSRQPDSPNTTMRSGLIFGNGSGRTPIVARTVPVGTFISPTVTGNADGFEAAGALTVGRRGAVPGGTRTVIACLLPSSMIGGQASADVIARAIATPSGPSSTHAALTPLSTGSSTRGNGAHAAIHSATPAIQRRAFTFYPSTAFIDKRYGINCRVNSATTIASSSATIASQRLRVFCAATNSLIAVSDATGAASNR